MTELRRVNAELLHDPAQAARARAAVQPFERYLARALVDGSQSAGAVFDEMVAMTEPWLAVAEQDRPDRPAVDRRIRAAVVTAMAVGLPLLHDHVSRALGADMFGPEGHRLLALALLDIYSHSLMTGGSAAAAAAGLTAL